MCYPRSLIADQVQIRINRCDEVTKRKDYIRMDHEVIRTLDPKITCFACQKCTAKRPDEQYSFEAETLHFSV